MPITIFDRSSSLKNTRPRVRFWLDNLAADGYRVLVAPDRAKAMALLATAHPGDLILVDVNGQTAWGWSTPCVPAKVSPAALTRTRRCSC